MAEVLLRELDPLFEDRQSIKEFKEKGKTISSEALAIAIRELQKKPDIEKSSVLNTILNESEDEAVKKAAIQELVRMKSSELTDILATYLRKNQTNSPAKVEAIRALGKAAIKRYLDRK
ncbi:MAG: hypothetical protein H3C47_10600 [Candidatus Cloacimonetes bacterium]|nr:hypothetical protein [Candidatus Cloacimonadota bacterium]